MGGEEWGLRAAGRSRVTRAWALRRIRLLRVDCACLAPRAGWRKVRLPGRDSGNAVCKSHQGHVRGRALPPLAPPAAPGPCPLPIQRPPQPPNTGCRKTTPTCPARSRCAMHSSSLAGWLGLHVHVRRDCFAFGFMHVEPLGRIAAFRALTPHPLCRRATSCPARRAGPRSAACGWAAPCWKPCWPLRPSCAEHPADSLLTNQCQRPGCRARGVARARQQQPRMAAPQYSFDLEPTNE